MSLLYQIRLLVLDHEFPTWDAGIEIAKLVGLVIEGRIDFVPETGRQSKVGENPPLVLSKPAPVRIVWLAVRPVLRLLGIVDSSLKEGGKTLSVGTAFEVVAILVAQIERDIVLIAEAAKLGAELQAVAASAP